MSAASWLRSLRDRIQGNRLGRTHRKPGTIRRKPTARPLLEQLEDRNCPTSVNPSISFADQLGSTTMTIAFDGTNYWSSSGGGPGGTRYAEYTSSGSLVATFAPGLDFRSVFTDAGGNVYAREYSNPTIFKQTSPGVFAPSGIVLSGGPLDAQSAVVFNGAGTEFIAMQAGTVSRWNTLGTYLGSVTLSGWGSIDGENNYPQYR